MVVFESTRFCVLIVRCIHRVHRLSSSLGLRSRQRAFGFGLVSLGMALAASCGGGAPPAGQGAPGGGIPAMPVEVMTIASSPVEDTADLIGTVKSRQSTTVQPQAEGFLTKINVASGAHVKAATCSWRWMPPLSRRRWPACSPCEQHRDADLGWAHQQAVRAKALRDVGRDEPAGIRQALVAGTLGSSAAECHRRADPAAGARAELLQGHRAADGCRGRHPGAAGGSG